MTEVIECFDRDVNLGLLDRSQAVQIFLQRLSTHTLHGTHFTDVVVGLSWLAGVVTAAD